MSHVELVQIVRKHGITPDVLTRLHGLVSQALGSMRSVLEEASGGAVNDVQRPIERILDDVDDMFVSATAEAVGEHGSDDTTILEAATVTESALFDGTYHVADGDNAGDSAGDTAGDNGAAQGFESRYDDLGLLGVGGMAEVRKVRERDLNRTLAMKIIKPEVMAKKSLRIRFIAEAQVSAQLQHPSIIPVHEIGRMPDGRYYFTMQEIRGRDLDDAIKSVHRASLDAQWRYDDHGWSIRQLVTALQHVCQAVGYAHARGVLHRDLKPSNIMVGRDGEVFVVDWGIAKVKGQAGWVDDVDDDEVVKTDRCDDSSHATRVGSVTGTPAYMSPEQAKGEQALIDTRSDVYSLGAILFKILTGRVPYQGQNVWQVLMAVAQADLEIPSSVSSKKIPEELEEICVKALSADQNHRYANAREMADELGAWLDGSKRREKALELVQHARDARSQVGTMLEQAALLRQEGEALLQDVPSWAPEGAKHQGWALADHAAALELNARLKELKATQTLHAALTHAPDLPEAHETLAAHHCDQHREAEAARDQERIRGEAILLRTHVQALPQGEARQGFASYLKGQGAVTLTTTPDGAHVDLFQFVVRHRRLVPVFVRSLGQAPLVDVALDMGSYLLKIRKEGYHTVHYPVSLERSERWEGIRPGSSEPFPIALPPLGSLAPNECYVPAGWFWAGGDPDAYESWPRRRYWADALVMQKFPVTNREYIAFLDDLVSQGREEEALRHVPREKGAHIGRSGPSIYGRDAKGKFLLAPDSEGDAWLSTYPVCMVNWYGAKAYAAWRAQRDRKAWRLMAEQEFEKAARGVDGRFFPWGDFLDPSWCCMRSSHQGHMLPALVDSFPVDQSVYGVRGLGGNMREWCEDIYTLQAPAPHLVVDPTLTQPQHDALPSDTDTTQVQEPMSSVTEHRVFRGGPWAATAIYCRAASRHGNIASNRGAILGTRLVRPWETPSY